VSKDNKDIALISMLLHESKLYRTGQDFKKLLDFIKDLPNFAPFNAFLLQLQKPGLRFAASAADWQSKFNRGIKEGARPLIILWPFSPIALVYDMVDTEGDDLPDSVAYAFKVTGDMTTAKLGGLIALAKKQGINVKQIEYGDGHAGHIKRPEHDITVTARSKEAKQKPDYQVRLNKCHDANVQFATLAHELAHLYLGHLGEDKFLKITERPKLTYETQELEAESVCYIVCHRNGVKPNSEQYLSGFVTGNENVNSMDLYALLKAAGQIETLLGLAVHTSFGQSPVQTSLF
jgi:hypothetical protein